GASSTANRTRNTGQRCQPASTTLRLLGTGSRPSAEASAEKPVAKPKQPAPTSRLSSQVRGRAAAWRERRHSPASARRRQKYRASAGTSTPAMAASSWPIGSSSPVGATPARARATIQAVATPAETTTSRTMATAQSRAKPASSGPTGRGAAAGPVAGIAGGSPGAASDIQVGDLERVVLDELAARFDH